MKRLSFVLMAAAAAAGGCQMERFRSQPLGEVPRAEAFQAAQAAFGEHFAIASADPVSGKIVSRPKSTQAARDRLLGSSPARQIAVMQLRSKGKELFADLRVEVQRQDVGAARAMQPVTVDTELPTRTPAHESAAITAEQNQVWETTGRDEDLERAILTDLLRRLTAAK